MIDFNEIKKVTDLNKNDIVKVLREIPVIHSKLIFEYQDNVLKYSKLQNEYEKLMIKKQISCFQGETNLNIGTIFKNKEDKEIASRLLEKEIDVAYINALEVKSNLNIIDKAIDYVKKLQDNIKTILEYEKFRAGR